MHVHFFRYSQQDDRDANEAEDSNENKESKEIKSLLPYAGLPKQILNDYKFSDCREFADLYAFLIYQYVVSELGWEAFFTVPVPCSLARRRNFGWDQVSAICRSMKKCYGIPTVSLLGRSRSSREQKKLSSVQRQENAESYFCRSSISEQRQRIAFSRMLLIDDVTTTGNTLLKCRKLLLENYRCRITCLAAYAD